MSSFAAQLSFWYEEGERFFLAVYAAKGEEGVRAVFQAPPTESVLISQPGWYLDPATRPTAEFDLEERLGTVIELMTWGGHPPTKLKMLEAQDLRSLGRNSTAYIHRFTEAQKLAREWQAAFDARQE